MNETKPATFSVQRSMLGLVDPWGAEVRSRLACLEQALGAHNFELRDDSRLAFLWATQRLDPTWDAREVCHEMMSMQFVCANTCYNELSQPFLRCLAHGLKERYGLRSWSTTWKIVREYGPDILKLVCLVESGLQIPNFMVYTGEIVPIHADDARTETTEGDDDGDGDGDATDAPDGITA